MSEFLEDRYKRNFNSLSLEDQKRLAKARVIVIGLGGLGGGVCEILARTGVGHLTLVDGDRFDPTNLNRQLLSREDLVGTPKALAAEERIRAINSDIRVEARVEYADTKSLPGLVRGMDLVVDCLDTIDARFLVQDAAQGAGIPLVSGAIAGMTGQVTTVFPKDRGIELIYGPREECGSTGIETLTGNLAACALMTAALQASESIKVLLGRGQILRNKLLIADLWSNGFETVDLE
ncbi:HesA/MoeB/ThiF family protein [Desulfospira joergensenii]|uniref:HesA/MoeB/ThiF family protein n=1 Tax=Desulfospira joergensenii TaxID=53329 RepID=UPI0003B36D5C|nr:HesA/MoeB/ThiF family protein [Desulfospira joergensenii]